MPLTTGAPRQREYLSGEALCRRVSPGWVEIQRLEEETLRGAGLRAQTWEGQVISGGRQERVLPL